MTINNILKNARSVEYITHIFCHTLQTRRAASPPARESNETFDSRCQSFTAQSSGTSHRSVVARSIIGYALTYVQRCMPLFAREIAQTNLGLVKHKCLRTLTKFQQNCYMGSILTF